MKVGTKSVLFGAHQFLIHPLFVALAWWQLYGFPWDPRLWVAFFVHDIGYFSCHDMDGAEGETHPELGAKIMHWLFGEHWRDFALLHSRFFSKRLCKPFSRLCVADKLAIVLTPAWLYLPMVLLTGEVWEYMTKVAERRNAGEKGHSQNGYTDGRMMTPLQWYRRVQDHSRRWVAEHKDGRTDTWTPAPVVEPARARELFGEMRDAIPVNDAELQRAKRTKSLFSIIQPTEKKPLS